jgi:CelD/BcsL family acetyltransferase involved in cellulose biosynthesis
MITPDDLTGLATPGRLRQGLAPASLPLSALPRPIVKAGPLSVTVLDTEPRLEAIRPAWDKLYARASAPRATLSYEWVSAAWRHIAEPEGGRLCIIAVHNTEGRLLALWPIAVAAHHRLWSRARQICASWDYNDILLDSNEDPGPLVELAWQALTRASGADLITLALVPAASPLHRLLKAKAATVTDQTAIQTIAWDGFANWQSYYRGISDRAGWDRRERRLGEQGQVAMALANTTSEAANALRWLLAQKRIWLGRKGKSSEWLHRPGYEDFLVSSVETIRDVARIAVFTLSLDGKLIAVQASLVDNQRMFCQHTAFDPAFAKFSPGILVLKHTLNWAFERRLPVDLGYGQECNKAALANRSYEVADFRTVNSTWGQWHQALKRFKAPPS